MNKENYLRVGVVTHCMGDETERVAAEVPSDLKKEIRLAAARRDTSMAAVIRETLSERFAESADSSAETEKEERRLFASSTEAREENSFCD